MAKPIPKKLVKYILERDEGICQHCGRQGANIHHIIFGGIGRRRIHTKENLVTLCIDCHRLAHNVKSMRVWAYEWSRQKYGDAIDELLQDKWSDKK